MSQPVADSEEILALDNDNDEVIGEIRRGDIKNLVPGGGKSVRAADIFIVRSDNKIWVPVRGLHKSIAPGGLDFSVGGHVASGDDYELTAARELEEEAGLEVDPSQLEHIETFRPTSEHCYFSRLYLLRTDSDPRLSDEHTSGSWMGMDELQHTLEAGTPAKASLLLNLLLLEQHLLTTTEDVTRTDGDQNV